ncbi:MAG TPA: type II and III secretion system protein [Bacteroidota bacterium]|nr:type II and III secretion system protein [Bacteroidota bacterium]
MKASSAILAVVALLWVAGPLADAQTQADRKALREYTSPQEQVSIAPTTAMDKALAVISEVSKKATNKIVIDVERRTMPINVDIQGFHWREALETICRKNGLAFTEYENYIQVTEGMPGEMTQGPLGTGRPVASGPVTTEIQKEVATFRSREIKLSAVFFEVNLNRLDEVGLNWSFMKSTSDFSVAAEFNGADEVSRDLFKTEVTPKVKFANMNFVAKFFSDYKLGEILSGPQLIVRSGEEGRIQVGQDFSIRERDFAGNLIDKFYSAGTIIKVQPQVIIEQGVPFIHVAVDVERSSVTPGQVSTIINKTQAQTNLLLLDGEETLIGGLYNNEVQTVRSGIPFLKDLPWYLLGLRYLFGYDKEDVTKKELVILLKAELVPTLQERITQKVKEEELVTKWREDWIKHDRNVRTSK